MHPAPQPGRDPRRSPKAPTVGTTESDQMLMMAVSALHAPKPVLQAAAFFLFPKLEIIIDMILGMRRSVERRQPVNRYTVPEFLQVSASSSASRSNAALINLLV